MRSSDSIDDVDIGRPSRKKEPMADASEIPPAIFDHQARFSLCITDRVLIGVREHARNDSTREVGGVLLGKHYTAPEKTAVMVTNFYPLPSNSRSAAHFSFDEVSQKALLGRPSRPDEGIVGWFHSHVRIGDPFMSGSDVKLHGDHFKKPWHVSLVVGGGEWSMPVGFWRMEGESLIQIQEHFVWMTPAVPPGEQSRRFLRACEEERPFAGLGKTLKMISEDLGLSAGTQLRKVLDDRLQEEAAREQSYYTLEPLEVILGLSEEIGSSTSLVEEVRDFRQQLRSLRFLEDEVHVAIKTAAIGSRSTIYGDHAITLNPGTAELFACDFVLNRYYRITLKPSLSLLDLCCGESGTLWVLASPNTLMWLPVATETLRLANDTPKVGIISLPEFDSEPVELAVGGSHVWLRTSARTYRLAVHFEEALSVYELTVEADTGLGTANSVLVTTGDRSDGTILGAADDRISVWAAGGQLVASSSLPNSLRDFKLMQCCFTSAGLLALFDNGALRHLVLFEPETLKLVALYLQDRPRDGRERLRSVCADGLGRGFIRTDDAIYLLGATGAPPSRWYHASNDHIGRLILRS